ncbi:hypothetical protein IFT72_10355 [Frigoribacterium sp. CFBP 8754]|uniref:hypothetical protein n=1 Tax=Frigoribacterium sp. CFBP 8754 TaxID=2775290 RepID=UPI00177E8926|nr:hypothetical protein [Frigoribacterium sp. CFBP 8754]MBD8660588.1 hypothetical protein [Frigoribacterium sp. CFBP 8754]
MSETASGGPVADAYAMAVPRTFVRVTTPGEIVTPPGSHLEAAQWAQFEQMRARLSESSTQRGMDGLVLDAFVTVGRIPGLDGTASVLVTLVPTAPGAGADLDRLLLARVARGAEAMSVGHEAAVAWNGDRDGTRAEVADDRVLRRRTVLARVAGSDCLMASFTLTVVSGRAVAGLGLASQPRPRRPDEESIEVADALVELFDAMMTTVRWLDDQGRVITDRPTT